MGLTNTVEHFSRLYSTFKNEGFLEMIRYDASVLAYNRGSPIQKLPLPKNVVLADKGLKYVVEKVKTSKDYFEKRWKKVEKDSHVKYVNPFSGLILYNH